ncbi:ATP-NAD kinase-like domain-containing protein [Coniella lustricola]|uniref:ATP-NAD kinase-like domain-containing protein n=1 Tax=Coniella lustricola TaxID=2025994 RepID=A0A2T3AKQ9_9PEZI|nr:ATP-NAD kinase-like domain-containing protein [Coniella lustricola]
MSWTVSRDAVTALKPIRLGDEAKDIEYTKNQIILPAVKSQLTGEGDKLNSTIAERTVIKTEQLVLLAGFEDGGYLLVTLNEAQPEDSVHFSLSSFLVPYLAQDLINEHALVEAPAIVSKASSSSNASSSLLDVIVSTHAGTHLALEFYDSVLQPFLAAIGLNESDDHEQTATPEEQGRIYRVLKTQDANSVKDFARKRWGSQSGLSTASSSSSSSAKETVILLSGDGGVVDLLNGIESTSASLNPSSQRPTIALIPLGTGNALFHSMHKPHYTASSSSPPSSLTISLRALLKGRSVPLPTFTASFSPGAHLVHGAETESQEVSHLVGAIVTSYGFHAQLVWESDTPAYRKFGAQRFGMVAQELLKELHKYDASVTISSPSASSSTSASVSSSSKQMQKRVVIGTSSATSPLLNYALVTLVSNLEKTFTISPASKPLDGALRLVYFEGKTGEEALSIMMGAYDGGKHVDAAGVEYRQASDAADDEGGGEVELVTRETDPRWRKVCIDGTIVELPEGGTMKVIRNEEPRLDVIFLAA